MGFITSDENQFLHTCYILHPITFLQYLLVLNCVLLNTEEFRLTFVTTSDFYMGPLNNVFCCILNPIHITYEIRNAFVNSHWTTFGELP